MPGKAGNDAAMESKFGCADPRIVVLQDHKRLPARFYAQFCGALLARLS